MKHFPTALFIVLLLPAWAAGGELSIHLDETTSYAVRFSTDIGEPEMDIVRLQDANWDAFNVGGASTTTRVGAPKLPFVHRLIAVPEGVRVTARVIDEQVIKIASVQIAPWRKPADRGGLDAESSTMDESIYLSDEIWPPNNIEIGSSVVIGGLRAVPVRYYPVRVRSASQRAYYATHSTIEVRFEGSGESAAPRATNPMMSRILRPLLLNPIADNEEDRPGAYVIICEDDFCDAVASLAEWKAAKGFSVEIATIGEIGRDAEAIQEFLSERYTGDGPPLGYVLLVGDVEFVPTLYGLFGTPADHKYATVDGDDYFADFAVGRMSGKTADEIAKQVEKTLAYEKMSDVAETDWIVTSVNISGSDYDDDANAFYCGQLAEQYGFATVDYFYQSMNTSTLTQVAGAINSGAGFVSYFGHGTETAWTSVEPEFDNDQVAELVNAGKPSVVNSIACANGAFDWSGDCFAEAWMKDSADSGAVLVFTAARNTPFFYTDALGKAVSSGYFEHELTAYGDLAIYAKMAMYEEYPEAAGGETEEVMQHFHIFGDPELNVRGAAPRAVDALSSISLLPGERATLRLIVASAGIPLTGAAVHLYGNGLDFFARADETGMAQFPLDAGQDALGLTAVVWGRDIIPATMALPVQMVSIDAHVGFLTVDDDDSIDDDAIDDDLDDDATADDDSNDGHDDNAADDEDRDTSSGNGDDDFGVCGL